jgi:hypothetical protein
VRTTDHGQATGKLYHLRLRVECTLFWYWQNRARINIKGSYPQKFPSIWGLNNLVVSEIPLYSTNYANNRHRLIWTLCKNYIQIGWKSKTFNILEIWTFRSLSVKFISETVKDRGNPSIYCRKLSIQFIQNKVKIGRKIKIL